MNYSISILSSFNPLFFALLAIAALLLGKAIYTYKAFPDLKWKAIKEMVVGGVLSLLIIGLFIVVPLISGITINKNELSLRLPTGFTFETLTGDDILSATVVDLEAQPEFATASKVVGTEIRDYREGIFEFENKTEVMVLLSGKKALYVETTGKPLLLGPGNFDNFVKDFSENLKPVNY
ncbi:MAG: PH domain-containing protein [Acetobacterium sp.]